MSIQLCLSEARNGNPVLAVRGFDRKTVVEVARRVNTWLAKACPEWKPYLSASYADQHDEGMWYAPVPLSYRGVCVAPRIIESLLSAMEKAQVEYEYIATFLPYVFPEAEEEVEDLVSLADIVGFSSMTKAQLELHCAAHGVTPPVRMTKRQLQKWMQDVLVPVHA